MCMSTSLAHVEIAETYPMESFLMAVRRFMVLHGVQRGSNPTRGPSWWQMATWDWSAVHETVEKAVAEWHVVPTGGQYYNGQAERLISLLKRCLESTMANPRSLWVSSARWWQRRPRW